MNNLQLGVDNKRKIGLISCLLFGMAMLLPIAPVPVYGVITSVSKGHMALAYLLAAIPMSFSALSFGYMGAEFPRAGSSYTFVSKSISPHLGFIVGWTILLDYGLFPLLNYICLAIYACELFPGLSFTTVIVASIILIAIVNLLGIKSLATINNILTIFGFLVAFYFIYAAINALQAGVGTGFSSVAFVNPATFSWGTLITGASIACFSFVGFDAITTLAEEVKEPTRTLPRAILITCLSMAVLFAVMSYLAQAVFPDNSLFTNPDAAFIDVARVAGGQTLTNAISLAMVAGALAFSLDMMAGVTRLLYGMGRDGVLPKKFFGYVSPKTNVPVYNVLLVTAFCLALTNISLGDLIPVINFGGLLAFICVNLSVITHFYIKKGQRSGGVNFVKYLLFPGLGALTCAALWLGLPINAKLIGGSWALLGIIYMAFYTKGFKTPMTGINEELTQ
jgi:putrescine importer